MSGSAPTHTPPPTHTPSSSPVSTSQGERDTTQLTASSSPSPTQTVDRPDNNFLQPGITPLPTPCSQVVFQVSTAILVQYDASYPNIPIESFQPSYRALGDGSLIAPPFDKDLFSSHLTLLIIGSLFTIFLRNVFVSHGYIKRGGVKKKTLFFVLLASQVLAPVSLFPVILSYFVQRVNCTAIIYASYPLAMISLGLLITGILGLKAYKCLEKPRFLLVILGILQVAATVFVILDLTVTKGARRLTGSCVQVGSLNFSRFFVATQFVQSLVVCLCFVYACYKSRGSPSARGRISVRLSMGDLPIQMPPEDDDAYNPQPRDHVPEPNPFLGQDPIENEKAEEPKPDPKTNLVKKLPANLVQYLGTNDQRRRYKPYSGQERRQASDLLGIPEDDGLTRLRGRHSSTSSISSRFSRLFPHMNLFRKVVKDELLYTTFITSTCVVVAVLASIGLYFETPLSVTGWIALNWAIISLLTVHSFGRVVRRREKEAWIHQAASRTVRITATGRRVQTRTPPLALRRDRSAAKEYGVDPGDPYSDVRPLDDEISEWQFGTIEPPPPRPVRSPILLSVRNVTPESTIAQEFEFERAPVARFSPKNVI